MTYKYTGTVVSDRTDSLAYYRYMTTISACIDCHPPRTLGQPDVTRPYAGGTAFELPGMTVRSANITPDMGTGIGGWSREFFIQKFKTCDPEEKGCMIVEPGSFNLPMPWTMYAGMTEDDLGAIYDYLMSVESINKPAVRIEFHE